LLLAVPLMCDDGEFSDRSGGVVRHGQALCVEADASRVLAAWIVGAVNKS